MILVEGLCIAKISGVIQSECNPKIAFSLGFFLKSSLEHFLPPQKRHRNLDFPGNVSCLVLLLVIFDFLLESDFLIDQKETFVL